MNALRIFVITVIAVMTAGLSSTLVWAGDDVFAKASNLKGAVGGPYDPPGTLFDNGQSNQVTSLASQVSNTTWNVRSADDFLIPAEQCPSGAFDVSQVRIQMVQNTRRPQAFAVDIYADNGAGTAPTPDDSVSPLFTFQQTSQTHLFIFDFNHSLYEASFDTPGLQLSTDTIYWISGYGADGEQNSDEFYNYFAASDGAPDSVANGVLISPDFEIPVWTPTEEAIDSPPMAFSFAIDGTCVPLLDTHASFTVKKEFTDDDRQGPANPTEVAVTLDCFTGLPITQSQTIHQGQDVEFIIKDFEDGILDCMVTEDTSVNELDGYTPTYFNSKDGPGSADRCYWENVKSGSEFFCVIENNADPMDVVIEKLWVIEGEADSEEDVDTRYKLTLYCNADIEDGRKHCQGGFGGDGGTSFNNSYESCRVFEGSGDSIHTARVTPQWPDSTCWVDETIYDSAVESADDCGSLSISHGKGDVCRVTNSIFFEGIPTLGQNGLAILALFTLGVGLLGFRRLA